MLSRISLWVIPSPRNGYRPKFLQSRVVLYVTVALLVLKIFSVAFYFPFPKNIFFADVTKSELVRLLNEQRVNVGMVTLSENQQLNQAARLKAQDMVNNNYFSHQSPQGVTPWFWFKQAGYTYKYAGENLAVGFTDSSALYDAWVNSPSHKANLLNAKYQEVGTAVVQGFGGGDTIVVVQLFGSPLVQASTSPVASTAPQSNAPVSVQPVPAKEPAEQPTPAPVAQAEPQPQPTEEVLSQQNELPELSASQPANQNTVYYRILNFFVYENAAILQFAGYVLLLALVIALLANIFINFEVQRKDLIFRSLLLIFFASMSVSINYQTISYFLPHYILI